MGFGALRTSTKIYGEPVATFFIFSWIIGTAWLCWFAFRLKKVEIDDKSLYVSNYREEIRIPLSEIERVKESFLTNPKQVTIVLRSPSKFGSRIVFVPELRFFDIFGSHPVVGELREIIKRYSRR